jgi:hypothetical protein
MGSLANRLWRSGQRDSLRHRYRPGHRGLLVLWSSDRRAWHEEVLQEGELFIDLHSTLPKEGMFDVLTLQNFL